MHRSSILLFILILTGFSILCLSCRRIDYFEKNNPVSGLRWKHSQPASGRFTISDTSSPYNIYLVLRHTDRYHFNNIWIELALGPAADTLKKFTLDLPLGNDAEGWEGTGMNDIWEVRKKLTSVPLLLQKPGEYSYSISHIMREDPLEGVMSVGLRVEKAP